MLTGDCIGIWGARPSGLSRMVLESWVPRKLPGSEGMRMHRHEAVERESRQTASIDTMSTVARGCKASAWVRLYSRSGPARSRLFRTVAPW